MNTREVRSRLQYDNTSSGLNIHQLSDLPLQGTTELVMHQTLSDSENWQDHDERDTLPVTDSISDGSEFVYSLGSKRSRAAYQWPFDNRDTFQRRPPYMSVFRKVWLIPIPFCMATFLCSAFWNLSQITGAWFLCVVTAIIVYPLVLVMTLMRLIAPIIHEPLLDFKQKLVSLPFIVSLAILAGWTWLIVAKTSTMIGRWDLCWWCALIGIICAVVAYL
jgi:hypothetical protein